MALILYVLVLLCGRMVAVFSQDGGTQIMNGGVLEGMSFLSATDGEIVRVTSPVTVGEDSSLTIGPGLTLLFEQSAGIKVLGRLRVEGTEAKPVVFKSETPDGLWEGLHISGPASLRSVLTYLNLHNTVIGVKVSFGASATLSHVSVTSPQTSGMVFQESTDVKLYDINIVSAPQESCAICVASGRGFQLDKCEINRGAGHTVGIQATDVDGVSISNCKISAGRALGIDFTDVYGNVTVTSSTFSTNYGGSLIKTHENHEAFVRVEKIRFTSVDFSGRCLQIVCPGTRPGRVTVRKAVVYGCERAVDITLNNQTLVLEDNQLYFSHQALHLELGHLASNAFIKGNLFYYNSNSNRLPAVSVAVLPPAFNGQILMAPGKADNMRLEVIANQFLVNTIDPGVTGDKSVVMLKFFDLPTNFLFQNNSLSNPAVQYDLALGATSADRAYVVDVSKNSWAGRKNKLQIEERILAQHLDPDRAPVLIEPFLISLDPYTLCDESGCECPSGRHGRHCEDEVSCEGVQNCTGHGTCVQPDVCQCQEGWQGASCSEAVCPKNCSFRGDCLAPDRCNCTDGYSGESCEVKLCPRNCSQHGECLETGQCLCDVDWTGTACEEPVELRLANCSGHGSVQDKSSCNCTDGWTGVNCSEPSCESLQNCNNNGNCTAPDVCLCSQGWFGESCSDADCSPRQNCSGHGHCKQPNICDCDVGRSGENCEICSEGFWGRDCLPCLECDHGTCTSRGACVCDSPRWMGSLCDQCSEGNFGEECLPLPTVTGLLPDGGSSKGGTVVLVTGYNLPNISCYVCRFGDVEVPGCLVRENEIECESPASDQLSVPVSVKPDSPEGVFANTQVNFTYFGECPENFCGENEDPSRGACVLGACSCNSPWSGDDCSALRLVPDIAKIPPKEILEFDEFRYEPSLIQGSEPISWTLASDEVNIQINPTSGLVSWDNVTAPPEVVQFTISCHNDLGSDSESVELSVVPVYRVTSLTLKPEGPFLLPVPVTLSGKVERHLPGNGTGPFRVQIRIKHGDVTRTLETDADPLSMAFEETFYPNQADSGFFSADARHPANVEFLERVSWYVMGLRARPTSVTYKGHVGDEISAGVVLENLGPEPLADLRYKISGELDNIRFRLWAGKRRGISEDDVIFTELTSGQFVPVNVTIEASVSVNTTIELTFTSAQMVSVTVPLVIAMDSAGKALAMEPTELNVTMFRGKERTYEVTVKNVGSESVFNLELQPPSSDVLSVVAFYKLDTYDLDYDFLDLNPGESAMMAVLLTPPADANPGEQRESIAVRSQSVGSTLWVNLYILSEETLNVTVFVTDEGACVTADDIGLPSAFVQLSNAARQFSMAGTTDGLGIATFPEVHEDYYELSVMATNHKSRKQVIFVTAGEAEFTVVLEKIAVNLSWVQTGDQSGVEGVDLKTDIAANVTAPVIVVHPSTVDLAAIETGDNDVINLRLENHGLVAASNVTVRLPEQHPFLRFHMDSNNVGEIPANGTVMVLVQVDVVSSDVNMSMATNNQTGRSRLREAMVAGVPHLVLTVLYSHTCGQVLPKQVDVILKRDGREKLPSNVTEPSSSASDVNLPDLDYNIPLEQTVFCEPCLLDVTECARHVEAPVEWTRCAAGVFQTIAENPIRFRTFFGGTIDMLELFLSCGDVPGYQRTHASNTTQNDPSKRCLDNFKKDCKEKYSQQMKGTSENRKENRAPFVAETRLTLQGIYDMRDRLLPESWDGFKDGVWFLETVKPILGNSQSNQTPLSEITDKLATDLPPTLARDKADEFFSLLREYSSAVLTPILGSLMDGLAQMSQEEFSDPVTWYNEELRRFREAPKGKQTCAKVKLRMDKKSVEVDDHVTVTMEIQNGDRTSLLDVYVTLRINNLTYSNNSSHLFTTDLIESKGFDMDNGTWILPLRASASCRWRVIPSDLAASTGNGKYEIWALIGHSFLGNELEVPVRGDTLTVTALPRLHINYFYPRYPQEKVHSLDNQTDLSFALGMVVMNVGEGPVVNTEIKSAKLAILSDTTQQVIRCKITDVTMDDRKHTPTFELQLGDIEPGQVRHIRWNLLCPEAGKFDNVTMSFVRINTEGDSILCAPELLKYHEVFHEVRVDTPGDDDDLVDYLVVSTGRAASHPDEVFRTDRQFDKSPVLTTDQTELHEVVTGSKWTELQMYAEGYEEGWYWLQIPYDFPPDQELKKVRRHDAKILLLDYNVWLTHGQDGQRAINIFDWFTLSDWGVRRKRQASAFNAYSIELGLTNRPPTFPKKKYDASVSENADLLSIFFSCPATDSDNAVTYYDLESDMDSALPFSVTDVGDLIVFGAIDHEIQPVYRLKLLAFDNGEPVESASTAVGINIIDENDNVPLFLNNMYSATISSNVSVGMAFLRVQARDLDLGENGRILYFIPNNEDLPFVIDSHGDISVKEPLTEERYTFVASAQNPNGSEISSAEVIVNVIQPQEMWAIFSKDIIMTTVSENQPIGTVVSNIFADDVLTADGISFDILSSVPFHLNESTGDVTTAAVLDREKMQTYKFTVRAFDDSPVGLAVRPEEVIVMINVTDTNDNAPRFAFPEVKLHVPEDTVIGERIHVTSAHDPDAGVNGEVVGYELLEEANAEPGGFGLNQTLDGAEIFLQRPLDREAYFMYRLTLTARDGGKPPQTGSVQLFLTVGDVNDNPPLFPVPEQAVNISKLLPVNSKVFTAQAFDNDSTSTLSYEITDASGMFRINSDSGDVTVRKSLKRTDKLEFSVLITVTDGLMQSNMTLTLTVSRNNLSPPVFESREYHVDVMETAPSGTFVETVIAEDADGDWFTFSIESGNEAKIFHIDGVTGEIMTRYFLDAEEFSNFTLTIGARDGSRGDPNTKIGYSTVYINVIRVNQHAPTFDQGQTIQVNVSEDSSLGTIIEIPDADDIDGDAITYSLLTSSGGFSVDEHNSDLTVTQFLDREVTPTVTLQLVATDNGSPPKSTQIEVVIKVLDINDNPPILSPIEGLVKVRIAAIRLKVPIYQVTASDRDSGMNAQLTYSISVEPPPALLRIDDSGAIYCLDACVALETDTTLDVVITVHDNGQPQRQISNSTTVSFIVSPEQTDEQPISEYDDAAEVTTDVVLQPSPTPTFGDVTTEFFSPSQATPLPVSISDLGGTAEAFVSDDFLYTTVHLTSFASEHFLSSIHPTATFSEDLQTFMGSANLSTTMEPSTTARPLPTAALPVDYYEDVCQKPIDAVIHDRAGLFFFHDNYVTRVFEGRRSVVRGYPKSIRRVFGGWRRKQISGPITAAVHSEKFGHTFLLKGGEVWMFEGHRLTDFFEIKSPSGPVAPEAAVAVPGLGILLIEGSTVYKVVDEYDFTLNEPEPLDSILPGAPVPLDGAFVNTDQDTLYMFSGDLVYEWNIAGKNISEASPFHITDWLDCEL